MQMTMPKIGELIKSGRAFVAEQWGLIMLATVVVPALVSIVSSVLEKILGDFMLVSVVQLVAFVVSLLVSLGAKRITLDLIDGKVAKIADIFSQTNLFWKFLLASIIYGVVVFVGFILLIIPGVYLALKYGFFGYILVDRPELSATESLSESARLTDGIKWDLFVFSLALAGINILGFIALGIGLLYTLPVSIMAYVALYRSLTRIASGSIESPAPSVEPVAPLSTETPSVA